MKAFVITGPRTAHIEERPVPELKKPDDVLVKVKYVGVCGSDVHTYDGSRAFTYPVVPGHEICGEVVKAGEAVKYLKPGTPVVHRIMTSCGHCYPCRTGHFNCCENIRVSGVTHDGGFEEYMIAPASQWIPFDLKDFSYRQAVMVEPFTIGAQAAMRGHILKGDKVLIHGAGPIGLVALVTALHSGAECTVSEVVPQRLEMALTLGAAHTIDPSKEGLTEAWERLYGKEGPNVVIDAVGLADVATVSLRLLSNAGRFVSLGFSEKEMRVPLNLLTSKELSIVGSRNENGRTEEVIREFPAYLEAVDKLQTTVLPFEESQRAFELAMSRDPSVIKVAVKVDKDA